MADSQSSLIWADALSQYTKTTGKPLLDARFSELRSAEDLCNALEQQQSTFSEFRSKRAKIFKALSGTLMVVDVLIKIGSGCAATAFPPSSLIFGAVTYLIEAARDVSAAYDAIILLFETMKESTCRLSVHLQQDISPELRRIVTEILVSLVSICAMSTKYINQGRTVKYLKGLLGHNSAVQGGLDRLKALTENEEKMVVALILSQTSKTGKVTDNTNAMVKDMHGTNAMVKDMHGQFSRLVSADMVQRLPQTFIVVDALDECSDWDGLLDVIEQIVEWKFSSLHLLVTSRKEKDIEARLQALQPVLIPVQSSQVQDDIRLHVRQCLFTEAKLKKWPAAVQLEMEEALVKGAQGM
ncbi:MAG: hypothetical protein M1826_002523 [Phylliscum demangeonii]|nr:MAG: hypothetical protein M1826_002523 [Phylliscum demangeonii]